MAFFSNQYRYGARAPRLWDGVHTRTATPPSGPELRLGDCLEVIKSTAVADDLESRRDFELEISCLVPDDEPHANILEHIETLLDNEDINVLQDALKTKCQMGGNSVRGDVVTWRADGRVFVSVSRSTNKMNGTKPANIAVKTYTAGISNDNCASGNRQFDSVGDSD